jgi:hypothetical protein
VPVRLGMQLMELMKLLDDDSSGGLSPHELIDVFDGKDNDKLLIKDCNGHLMNHHWVGDGYCDDGKDRKDGGADFNCNIFLCDDGDCKNNGLCRTVKGRTQVELKVDAVSAVYGNVKDQMGQEFEVDFKAATKYYIYTTIEEKHPGHIQDTVLTVFGANKKQIFGRNDDGPYGKDNSYLELTLASGIKQATIQITPKTRADRGTFQMWVQTQKPCCKTKPCKMLEGLVLDACGTCGGNIKNKAQCPTTGR